MFLHTVFVEKVTGSQEIHWTFRKSIQMHANGFTKPNQYDPVLQNYTVRPWDLTGCKWNLQKTARMKPTTKRVWDISNKQKLQWNKAGNICTT